MKQLSLFGESELEDKTNSSQDNEAIMQKYKAAVDKGMPRSYVEQYEFLRDFMGYKEGNNLKLRGHIIRAQDGPNTLINQKKGTTYANMVYQVTKRSFNSIEKKVKEYLSEI